MNSSARPAPSFRRAVLITGFIAGTLDILTACFYLSSKNPVRVLNYVASGVFGKTDAYAPGALMPLMGLLFHYIVAYLFTLFFFLIYPVLKLQKVNKFLLALLYGLFVWTVMNRIVVPLSNVPPPTFNWTGAIKNAAILIVMIGLPVSFGAGKYYQKLKIKN